MSASLDTSLVNRAAPPGSMRYFAWLYTPEDKRDALTALFIIDAEIRESAQSPNHDVAHTRLQWWRQEIDRLVNANPQHPATRVLNATSLDRRHHTKLHELIAAADMDLARMTYLNEQELRAYCARSGGAVSEVIASQLAVPIEIDESARAAANRLGALVRTAEVIRDARQDAYDGRVYVPLDILEREGAHPDDLREKTIRPALRRALASLANQARSEIDATIASIPAPLRAYLRPLCVLGALHAALLSRIASLDFDVGRERIELGPIRKPWVAWRAARSH